MVLPAKDVQILTENSKKSMEYNFFIDLCTFYFDSDPKKCILFFSDFIKFVCERLIVNNSENVYMLKTTPDPNSFIGYIANYQNDILKDISNFQDLMDLYLNDTDSGLKIVRELNILSETKLTGSFLPPSEDLLSLDSMDDLEKRKKKLQGKNKSVDNNNIPNDNNNTLAESSNSRPTIAQMLNICLNNEDLNSEDYEKTLNEKLLEAAASVEKYLPISPAATSPEDEEELNDDAQINQQFEDKNNYGIINNKDEPLEQLTEKNLITSPTSSIAEAQLKPKKRKYSRKNNSDKTVRASKQQKLSKKQQIVPESSNTQRKKRQSKVTKESLAKEEQQIDYNNTTNIEKLIENINTSDDNIDKKLLGVLLQKIMNKTSCADIECDHRWVIEKIKQSRNGDEIENIVYVCQLCKTFKSNI